MWPLQSHTARPVLVQFYLLECIIPSYVSWSITALKNTAFYMFHWSVVKSQCFSTTSTDTYDANMEDP